MTEMGHLLVADALAQRFGWSDRNRSALFVGAVGPDAYRTTQDVTYRELHFRSSRQPGLRLTDFLQTYLRPALRGGDTEARAFFCGWLSHVCTDYVWRQQIRFDLPHLWDSVLAAPRLESVALKHQFYDECDWVDIQMQADQTELIDEIRWVLMQVEVRFTVPPLQLGDIFRWRQQVLEGMLPPANYTVETPKLLDVGFVRQAIEAAVAEAGEMIAWEMKQAEEEAAYETTAPTDD
jgi:hypothetical protein